MNVGRARLSLPSALASLWLSASAAPAQAPPPTLVHTTAELRQALAKATPGTQLQLAPGDYDGFTAHDLQGTAPAPIVVRAADPRRPPVVRGGIQLSDCAHFELDGLHVEGAPQNGLNLDDGGTFATPSHHVVLRNLVVRDGGGRGNHDGIKLSGVVDFEVVGCTIERWGRGGSGIDMVGCQRGLLRDCTLRDRADGAAANGVQMKGGSRDITVRSCRFDHAGERAVQLGGSTGLAWFRPSPAGFEAKDLVVEGCTFVGSTAPIAFVGCDGAIVRHNTLYRPGKWMLRIMQETREAGFVPCRDGVFTDNLIVWDGLDASVNVGPDTAPDTFRFARNHWFRLDAPDRSAPRLPTPEAEPNPTAAPRFVDAAAGDLRQRADSPTLATGADSLPRRDR